MVAACSRDGYPFAPGSIAPPGFDMVPGPPQRHRTYVAFPPARGPPIETAISRCALASEVRVAPAPEGAIETAISRCALASEVRVASAPGGADRNVYAT